MIIRWSLVSSLLLAATNKSLGLTRQSTTPLSHSPVTAVDAATLSLPVPSGSAPDDSRWSFGTKEQISSLADIEDPKVGVLLLNLGGPETGEVYA